MYKDMLYIKKGKPPKSFIEYTREKCARFDDMPPETKKELRRSLLEEQGYLCAYCMRRIADGGAETKIEHLQARNLSNELVYQNLLAVCHGNEGRPREHQTCDSRKGNRKLQFSPLDIADMNTIYYDHQGHILSTKNGIQQELDDVLNLNDEDGYLIYNRQKTLHLFLKTIRQSLGNKSLTKTQLEKKLRFYEGGEQGKKVPYCGIIVWYLRKRLGLWKR